MIGNNLSKQLADESSLTVFIHGVVSADLEIFLMLYIIILTLPLPSLWYPHLLPWNGFRPDPFAILRTILSIKVKFCRVLRDIFERLGDAKVA